MPQELQKHLRGADQILLETSLVNAELGFNEGVGKEAVYRLSDGSGHFHFPSKERLEQSSSALQSGAKLIGFAPPEGMANTNVQDAIGELNEKFSLLPGNGRTTGGAGGTAGAPLEVDVAGMSLVALSPTAGSQYYTFIGQAAGQVVYVVNNSDFEARILGAIPGVDHYLAGAKVLSPFVYDGVLGYWFGMFPEFPA